MHRATGLDMSGFQGSQDFMWITQGRLRPSLSPFIAIVASRVSLWLQTVKRQRVHQPAGWIIILGCQLSQHIDLISLVRLAFGLQGASLDSGSPVNGAKNTPPSSISKQIKDCNPGIAFSLFTGPSCARCLV